MKKVSLVLIFTLLLTSGIFASTAFARDDYVEKPGCGHVDGPLVCVKHYVWLRPNYNPSNGYGYRHAVSEYCTSENGTAFNYDTYNEYCTLGEWIIDDSMVSCTYPVVKYQRCTVCGAKSDKSFTVIPDSQLPHQEVIDEAVPATCISEGKTEGKHCSVCNRVLVKQEIVQVKEHTEVIDEAIFATCTTEGKTEGKHCPVCKTVLEKQETIPATGHYYLPWSPAGEHQHIARCSRERCTYTGNTSCTLYECQTGEERFFVCPVCGEWNGGVFEAIKGADCVNVGKNAIPRGELVVRGTAKPFGSAPVSIEGMQDAYAPLYAMTVAYELAGQVEAFQGAVKVSVPLDIQASFRLVRRNTGAEEAWTDIPFTITHGCLTFETDQAGLFLLLAAD